MRISDWSSDVCSSDLVTPLLPGGAHSNVTEIGDLESDKTLYDRMLQDINPNLPVPGGSCFWAGHTLCLAPDGKVSVCVISHGRAGVEIGRASCRERVCQYV